MIARTWIAVVAFAAAATMAVASCSSKDPLLRASDASGDGLAATGGSAAGTGGAPPTGSGGGAGTPVTGGRGGGGAGGRGSGGTGAAGMPGTGGHDIAPVICGTATCPLGDQCCHGCNGSMTCGTSCPFVPVCPADAGADSGADPDGGATMLCGGKVCGTGTTCCGPPSCGFCRNDQMGVPCQLLCPALDAGADVAMGSIACGAGSCGPQEACVHPPRGGTCLMPEAGVCPTGTSLEGGCCLPPDSPRCVPIDRACSGPTVTCACFSRDPCNAGCSGARITGHDIVCVGA